jgi:cytoskeletal protein RodZ
VSIGATLGAARRRAGLTVSEVSHSTRVTEPIIRGIELDDYAACGGDFYARGHIRAIARAVGEDPLPLIDEFDSTWRSATDITAAEAFQPGMPLRKRERRRVRWTAFLAVLVLAVLGFAGYKFVSGAARDRNSAAATPRPSPPGAGTSRPSASAPAVQAGTIRSGAAQAGIAQASPATSSAVTTPSASTTPSGSSVAVQALTAASVAAFGPSGTADGDNPQLAALAVGGNAATPWSSQWYATPGFADLKTGTGLLLDMGHPVTVSSVRLWLASRPGADLELRAGAKPVPSWLPKVSSASNADGTVQVKLSAPVRVRYLLIWFTKLPPDSAGTYQASVYKITVQGQP